MDSTDHARALARLSVHKRNNSGFRRKRHMLAPMSMEDVAKACNLSHSEFYRQLKGLGVSGACIREMPLNELWEFICLVRERRAEQQAQQAERASRASREWLAARPAKIAAQAAEHTKPSPTVSSDLPWQPWDPLPYQPWDD